MRSFVVNFGNDSVNKSFKILLNYGVHCFGGVVKAYFNRINDLSESK